MDLVEALADSIMRFEGWTPPGVDPKLPKGSHSWRNRNPGNLRPDGIQRVTPQAVDSSNYRIFANLTLGWDALRSDIRAKLQGSHDLTDESTLRNLFDIYAPSNDDNDPDKYALQVAVWLSRDLNATITPETTLGYLKGLGS